MLWVGLTGGIASGKSTVANLLIQMGIPVIDADQISRELTQSGTKEFKEILQYFGPEILDKNGQIDRRKLGEIVFKDREKLLKLESLLHPKIQQEVLNLRKKYEQQGHRFAVYDVPLLFEKKLMSQFDLIIVVHCSEDNQRMRLKMRNSLSDKEIDARLQSQLPVSEKINAADFAIENNKGIEELKMEVEKVCNSILKIHRVV